MNDLNQNCDAHIFQKQCSQHFFKNLNDSLQCMTDCFRTENNQITCIKETEQILQINSCETRDLIHLYYLGRLKEQHETNGTPFGQLTIRCGFIDDYLEVNRIFLFLVNLSLILAFLFYFVSIISSNRSKS